MSSSPSSATIPEKATLNDVLPAHAQDTRSYDKAYSACTNQLWQGAVKYIVGGTVASLAIDQVLQRATQRYLQLAGEQRMFFGIAIVVGSYLGAMRERDECRRKLKESLDVSAILAEKRKELLHHELYKTHASSIPGLLAASAVPVRENEDAKVTIEEIHRKQAAQKK